MNILTRIRIPTILGLGVIILGTAVMVYLTERQQTTTTKAALDLNPQDIRLTNIEDTSATVSWITDKPTTGFVTYSLPDQPAETALDDRDSVPSNHLVHFVSLKNLVPKSSYEIRITSGNLTTNPISLITAAIANNPNKLKPVIGTVLNGDQNLTEGLAYLDIPGASEQSALIKNFGAFLIPINQLRKKDLSGIFNTTSVTTATITIIGGDNQTAKASFILDHDQLIGPLKIGQQLDLTAPPLLASASASLTPSIQYDLNGDGIVNASDYAVVLSNLGKKPKNPKADLNRDGIVDNKDLQLIQSQIPKTQ